MRTTATMTIAGALLLAGMAVSVDPAAAQARKSCPEGRLANGACVNPDQAQDLRTGSIALAQHKLSMTNPPVLPSQDGLYDVPRDHHEIRSLHGYPPITSVNGRTITYTTVTLTPPGCSTACVTTTTTTTVNTGPLP